MNMKPIIPDGTPVFLFDSLGIMADWPTVRGIVEDSFLNSNGGRTYVVRLDRPAIHPTAKVRLTTTTAHEDNLRAI